MEIRNVEDTEEGDKGEGEGGGRGRSQGLEEEIGGGASLSSGTQGMDCPRGSMEKITSDESPRKEGEEEGDEEVEAGKGRRRSSGKTR